MTEPSAGLNVPALTKSLLRSPRQGMREVLSLGIRDTALFQFAALMVVLASIAAYLISVMAPAPEEADGVMGPLGYILVAGGNLVVTSVVLYWGGRMIGGKGDFQNVLLAMSVHQGATIIFQIVFAFSMILWPTLGSVILTVGVFYLIYLMAAYVAEVHELRSVWAAVGLIVGMIFLLAFLLLFIFSLLGVSLTGGPGG